MDTSHHHLISNTSIRNNHKFKIKNNRSISNMRSYKQSITLNDLTYPSTSSLAAVCHSETIPKRQTLSSLISSTNHNKNLHMYHIRYEFLANKKHNENEMSLKHDILVLIAQLKEKEEIISEMKKLLNKYEDNKSNLNNNNNNNIQQLLNDNKKLKNDIKGLNVIINKYKHMINNVKKFDSSKFKECRQYSLNYIILNTNISQIKRKIIQHNNSNHLHYINDANVFDLQLSKLTSFSKRENNKHSNLIFKPLIENKILQYDCITNSYTLIVPIDYSNFFVNYSKCGSRYITINNVLYIVSGISFNILYSFNPISNALLKIATLAHNHKHCGLIAYQDNKIAIIAGENTTSIELYDITSKKLLLKQNLLVDMNIPEIPCTLSSNCSFITVNKDIIVCFGEFNDTQINNNCCLIYVMKNNKWECLKLKGNFPLKSGLLFNNCNGTENVVYLYTTDGKFFQINIENGNIDLIKDNMNGVINNKEISFDFISTECINEGKGFVYFYDSNNNVYKISLANFETECDYY